MQETFLTSGGRVAETENVLPVSEATRLHSEAREAAQAADARLQQVKGALGEESRTLMSLQGRRQGVLAEAVNTEIKRLLDGGAGDTRPAVRELSELAARIEISTGTLQQVAERLIPEAEVASMDASATLKDAAASMLDARRWERLREHSAALGVMAESEGAVEIRAARFDLEGVAANELRSEAATLREGRRKYVEKVAAMAAALGQARGQA